MRDSRPRSPEAPPADRRPYQAPRLEKILVRLDEVMQPVCTKPTGECPSTGS